MVREGGVPCERRGPREPDDSDDDPRPAGRTERNMAMRMRDVLLAGLGGVLGLVAPVSAQDLDAGEVEGAIWRAAEWQIAHPEKFLPVNWEMSPLYDGLLHAGRATGEPSYVGEVLGFGKTFGWSMGPSFYFADDHAVGHAWLDLYLADPSETVRLRPTQERFDAILANPETRPLEIGRPGPATDRWTRRSRRFVRWFHMMPAWPSIR